MGHKTDFKVFTLFWIVLAEIVCKDGHDHNSPSPRFSFSWNDSSISIDEANCEDSDEIENAIDESNLRFAYLLTGEDESTFALTSVMLGPHSDVYQCIWGEPISAPSALNCTNECTGDYQQVCRNVCRDSSPAWRTDGTGQLRTLYVRGSSFNQGRNHLYEEARRLGGGNYLYYILVVDDLELYNGLRFKL